ncbi:MAG: hypothetical protein IJK81_04415 [Selenomonadaceae bacterium]|nr:hypothetical protein [Selenomonadaceae bacterium]
MENKNFLEYMIEAKNKIDERKAVVKMLSLLAESKKILAIMDKGYYSLKIFEQCNRIENLVRLVQC